MTRAMWRDVACDGKHTRGSVAGASDLGRIVRAFDIKGAAFDLTCSGLDQFSCGNRVAYKEQAGAFNLPCSGLDSSFFAEGRHKKRLSVAGDVLFRSKSRAVLTRMRLWPPSSNDLEVFAQQHKTHPTVTLELSLWRAVVWNLSFLCE